MAVKIPPELNLIVQTCAICDVNLPFARATAGHYDATNQQAFACVSHLSEVELLVVGWADFMAAERDKYMREAQEGLTSAWLNP